MKKLTLAAALALLLSSAAQADTNLVGNGSFEQSGYTLASGSYCYLGVPGQECGGVPSWSGVFPLMLSSSSPWGVPNTPYGNVLIGIQNNSVAEQSLALAAGNYSLGWSDAGRANWGTGAEQYEVLFDGITLATESVAIGAAWQSHTVGFTATGAGTLTFRGLNTGGDATAFIDGVSVSAVPEPEVFAMMLLGLVLIGYRASRDSDEKFTK